MQRIEPSDPGKNFVTTEDDTLAVTLLEPHKGIDESARVGCVSLGVVKERGSSGSIPTIEDDGSGQS
jgi:hypothetical protein